MLEADNKDIQKKISALTKENEKLTKKLQEAEAQVFDYKMKCLIILVVCIVVWFTKNVVVVPNMRKLKYLP
ncbi:hypothetical protein RHMOL_Rhmol09G0089200 [Rhododendron molle]|uniref:Uncharacterized protein n=1 Tax=Rhododendron molle TaxID=49168 RepID=A0ACC0MBD6_RHOML|nr:hypothetical protein RHMOL_Rhmol09G0089200 [Rhododendron molle]